VSSLGKPTLGQFLESWDLFRDAVLTGALSGVLLGYLGVFIVLRRMVFVSAAISQAAALGVALTFLADVHGVLPWFLDEPVSGALLFALASMGLLAANPERIRLTREALLGFVYLFCGAATVLVMDRITQEAHDVSSILFGPGVVVHPIDFHLTIAATVILLGAHLVLLPGLVFTSFDEESARVQRLPVRWLNGFLFMSVGVAVALATHAIGALSAFGLGVLPAMGALALSSRLGVVLVLAPVVGLLAGGGGYLFAFLVEFPVGGSQTFLASLFCGVAMVVAVFRKKA
jgi:zinc transport system permease protein